MDSLLLLHRQILSGLEAVVAAVVFPLLTLLSNNSDKKEFDQRKKGGKKKQKSSEKHFQSLAKHLALNFVLFCSFFFVRAFLFG